MPNRPTHVFHLLAVLLLALLSFAAVPARAAQPGEELITSNGSLSPGQTFTTPLYSPGVSTNFRLHIDGGAEGDRVTMTLLNGGTTVKSWAVRSGETSWSYATLPNSNGKLTLHNESAKTLTYTLSAYARATAPAIAEGLATWSGTARGSGIQSAIQLNVVTAGRYRFMLNAVGGSFQVKVDTNHLLKTVVPGKAPNTSDSVYYLGTGIHTFTIVQDTAAAQVNWSIALASLSDLDPIPSTESSQVLGGNGFFSEEWIPLQVAVAQQVSLSITATGGPSDSLVVELYNGATKVFTNSNVFGGEVAWSSSALAAGANKLHVVAAGNSAALAYSIAITPIAQAPFTWRGVTYGTTARTNSGHSSIHLMFPRDSLYQFTLGASAGRYQFLLDNRYIQKTVTDTASTVFTAFVPAGSHTLVVAQDPAVAVTTWSVAVTPATPTSDTLPFRRVGGTLGGAANAFREEWLPLRAVGGAPINLRVTAAGAASDSLRVELYNSGKLTYSAATIYGGEVFWGTSALTSGTNLVHIIAAGGNAGQMSYQVELRSIATIPSVWQGVALDHGLNSVVQLSAPVAGTYAVTLTVVEGAGQVLIDQGTPTALKVKPLVSIAASTTVLRVPLSAGLHSFKLQQDTSQQRTVWQVAAQLRRADQVDQSGKVKVYLPLVRR